MDDEDYYAWTEITQVFDPVDYIQSVMRLLADLRVIASGDDRLYTFIDKKGVIQHAAYHGTNGWQCPCKEPQPCPAVAVMQVASFSWTFDPFERQPQTWGH